MIPQRSLQSLPESVEALAVEGTVRQQRLQYRVDAADRMQVLARKRPPGFMSAISGVRFATRAKSSSVKRMPASCAIAGMCSAALVEPPVAATAAQAFSRLFLRDQLARQRAAVLQQSHDGRAGSPRERLRARA